MKTMIVDRMIRYEEEEGGIDITNVGELIDLHSTGKSRIEWMCEGKSPFYIIAKSNSTIGFVALAQLCFDKKWSLVVYIHDQVGDRIQTFPHDSELYKDHFKKVIEQRALDIF